MKVYFIRAIKITIFFLWLYFVYLVIITPGFFVLEQKTAKTAENHFSPNTQNKEVIIYYISLPNAKSRLKKLRPLIDRLNFPNKKITAINGEMLSTKFMDDLISKNIFKYFALRADGIKKGEIGCYLSHTRIWQEFLQTNYSYAIILEDDVSFNPDQFNNLLPNLITHRNKWDILKLNKGGNSSLKLPVAKFQDPYKLYYILENHENAAGYIINRKAAITLLNYSKKIALPLDFFIERTWETGLKLLAVEPNLVHIDYQLGNYNSSGINKSKVYKINNLNKNSFIYKIKRMICHSKTELMNFFYNLYLWMKNV